jgi:tRNA dimethylallyltransferase
VPRVLAILGPTAVGKTAVAIRVAERLGGEIVSCDSRQIFKHLNIGTAKPSETERKRAVFHLIDMMIPDRFMNAHEFRRLAETAIDDIISRGKVPLMTVGTGFYFKAMTDGIFEAPSADEGFRKEMEIIAESDGLAALHERLSDIDPKAASEISGNDKVRVVRALELHHLTGKTRSELSNETQLPPSPYQFVTVELAIDREELYDRINRRCEQMLVDGLIEEAKSVREGELLTDEMAERIVGYKEAYEYLNGRCDLDEMLSRFQQATRNYAKRQMTWFRKHAEGLKFDVSDKTLVDNILRGFDDA